MGSLPTLAIQASMPFALAIFLDDGARWRGAFGAFYALSLVGLCCVAAGPDGLQAYAELLSRTSYCPECLP